MSIEEHLADLKSKHEMLSERHNALVQSIELMILSNREELGQLTLLVKSVVGAVKELSHVAELHQHRIDSHDDRLDKLEGAA